MADYDRLRQDVEREAAIAGRHVDVITVEFTESGQPCELCEYVDSGDFSVECAIPEDDPSWKPVVAHEYAHILVRLAGLISIVEEFPRMDRVLRTQIGNAISHLHVIRVLDEYDIPSASHFDACARSLPVITDTVRRPDRGALDLIGAGVALFDISRCVPGATERTDEIAAMNEMVAKAMSLALDHLGPIAPTMDKSEQRRFVESFLCGMHD